MSAPVIASPSARLTALLVSSAGATVRVPRKLLAEVVKAQGSADRERQDAARGRALERALTHREASLASVPLSVVWAYLHAHGWTTLTPDGLWTHDGPVTQTPASEATKGYAVLLWRVAVEVGDVEGRPPALVLADWLVATPPAKGA